ncbi:unnamed protein product [Haemonchus placei]|uniref:Uncharacterized protein n=1 Tax=Haemonchus placei TaxID=6290 RepID=A0A3P7VM50_HAEPC|nr:unnamed protein product [Haemonchus placei]
MTKSRKLGGEPEASDFDRGEGLAIGEGIVACIPSNNSFCSATWALFHTVVTGAFLRTSTCRS